MTWNGLIDLLNKDLEREYSHWHFYIHAASVVTGLHREEYREFFMEEAKGEMEHILQFRELIIGLGGIPVASFIDYSRDVESTEPDMLLLKSLQIEQEVVANYVQRMDDAENYERNGGQQKIDGRYLHIFLEDQILDSRSAVDNIKQMLNC